MEGELQEVSSNKMFGGWQKVYSHYSEELSCKMNFGIYLPPGTGTVKLPCLYFLSGLSCTEQNFITKAGSQSHTAQHDIVVVTPDTSPRGCGIEGEDESYDFGSGAGFYLDATVEKWKTNYRMYSYMTRELPDVISRNFPVNPDRISISGHSMGGHGALVCALRNPGMYRAVSAFSPICNPMQCPWGIKAFTGYLGEDKTSWEKYDACTLVKSYRGPTLEILVDQGRADNFLSAGQLLPDNLRAACAENEACKLRMRTHEGYDHSYYFISTFVEDHVNHHVSLLKS